LWSTAVAGGPFGYGQVFAVTTSGAEQWPMSVSTGPTAASGGRSNPNHERCAVRRDREARKDCRRRVGVR
jgi:hypothetical protein